MSNTLKILVSGDVGGRFTQLFNRVAAVQKKAGNFDLLFCVGDFFGEDNSEWEKYTSGALKVPVPTFVLGPNNIEHIKQFGNPDGCELCPNVTYLGQRGLYTGASGLTVAYLSGRDGTGEKDVQGDMTYFSARDIDVLRTPLVSDSKFKGVDLLFTSPWPLGVDKYATTCEELDTKENGSAGVAHLALGLKPRYHFSGSEGVHYERQPYRNHRVLSEKERHATRFIALAKVGNAQKKKYLYAFNIVPMKLMDQAELTKQPADVTECPFKLDKSFSHKEESKGAQFFFDPKSLDGNPIGARKRKGERQERESKSKKQAPMGPCWFCLGSPQVQKHLVVSVGTNCYLALAKGGLTPDHVMILPISHQQSLVSASKDVAQEVEKYKSCLRKFYRSQGKGVVFFERNFKTVHLQMQAIPLPESLIPDVKETFDSCAQDANIELSEIPKHSDVRQIVPDGVPYFYTELPSGEKMFCRISGRFPLQFAREAMASDTLLDLEDNVDWRKCSYSHEEELDMATSFKKSFKNFDFNLLE